MQKSSKQQEEERLRKQIREAQQAKQNARARVDALRAEVQRAQEDADSAVSQQNQAQQESSKAFDNMVKAVSEGVKQDSLHTTPSGEQHNVPADPFQRPQEAHTHDNDLTPPYLASIHIASIRRGDEIKSSPFPGSVITVRYEIARESIDHRSALGRLLRHEHRKTLPSPDEPLAEEVPSPSEYDYIALYKVPQKMSKTIQREDVWKFLNPQQDHFKVEFLDPLANAAAVQKVAQSMKIDERPDSFEELLTVLSQRKDKNVSSENAMSALASLPSLLEGTVSMTLPSEEGIYFIALVTSKGCIVGVCPQFEVLSDKKTTKAHGVKEPPRRSYQEPSGTTEILGPSLPAVPTKGPASSEQLRQPNFCLEKQPKISVYQLYIHVPALKDLPKAWCPAFSVRDGCLLVYFAIPEELSTKYGIYPRHFFLQLSFPYRLELEKAILHIKEDHVSLRLPLYFRGEAIPDRKQRYNRKQLHEELAHCNGFCRFCTNRIWSAHELDKAFDLPSSNWHEWSEFWLCHSNERGHLLPQEDVTAHPHKIGIGDRCLMLHPMDVLSSACKISLHRRKWDMNAASSALNLSADTVNLKTFTWDTFSRAATLTNPDGAGGELGALRCQRCRCLLGICVASPYSKSNRADLSLNEAFPKSFTDCAMDADPQPSLCYFSDKISLQHEEGQSRHSHTLTEFRRFSPAHRLGSELFSLSNAHNVYRFLICPSTSLDRDLEIPPHATEVGVGACIALDEDSDRINLRSKLLESDAPALAITVLNWNTSMTGYYHPYERAQTTLLSEASDGASLNCWQNNDSPYPSMKVRYLLSRQLNNSSVEASTQHAISRGKLRQWVEHHHPYLWTMFPEDFRAICRTLVQSTQFLPSTCQEDRSMYFGFLPMATSVLQ